MRIIAFALALILFASACFALDITTRDGATYRRCEIRSIEPDGIVIMHSDGIAWIPYENLPLSIQTKYHFDPAKVAEYRKHLAEAQAAEAKKAVELRAQNARAAQLRKASEQTTPSASLVTKWWTSPSETQLIALLVGGATTLAVCYSLSKRLERYLHWRRIRVDAHKYLALLDRSDGLPTIPTDILLQPAERSFYCASSALYETRAVRYYQSGFAGFRVARGIWIGGSGGRSVSNQEWAKLDTGTLTVTNQRLVFDGAAQTRTIPLQRIVSVNSMCDSVEVSVENRQKSMVFEAANPLILSAIIRLASKGYDEIARSAYRITHTISGDEYDTTQPSSPSESPPPSSPKPKRSRPRRTPKSQEVENDYDIHARTLGLSGVFGYSDVKKCYYERIKEYHPDKVAALGPKLREVAENESKKINAAYEFFTQRFEVNRDA